jgi:hypothetical protein
LGKYSKQEFEKVPFLEEALELRLPISHFQFRLFLPIRQQTLRFRYLIYSQSKNGLPIPTPFLAKNWLNAICLDSAYNTATIID